MKTQDHRLNDHTLVQAALSGKTEAYGAIITRYQASVFGVALSRLRHFHDAEDIAQGVFVEAYNSLERLQDPTRLGAWLRSITVHRCIDHLRQKRDTAELDIVDEHVHNTLTPHIALEKQETQNQVMRAIKRLSKTQRETTILFYIEGYTLAEIAAIQDIPTGTVKRRLHDARAKLKEDMWTMVEEVLKDNAPKEDFAKRVFDLLCSYPESKVRPSRKEIIEELRKIGTPGIEGFIKAFALPHWRTRKETVKMFWHIQPEPTEVVIDLLKKGLEDSNKKVRRSAIIALMKANVPEERKRKEFIPLLANYYTDPSKRVRGVLIGWLFGKYALDIPVEKLSDAIAQEKDRILQQKMRNFLLRIYETRRKNGLSAESGQQIESVQKDRQ